ncbi:hypothetical protein [Qipengyuania zhejiangensis]|uniref:hypothetical protein n=1 Tax=Qipengyuania zhejiangensis TaxID=3077782 RepID=UPI002D77F71F|nr:hypothetical protein [Qipengyuania sp. Z2]
MSSPYPRPILAFASSTANDLSAAAFAHILALLDTGQPDYASHLENLRQRMADAYGIAAPCEIVFAPSGTDLEYVALAAVLGRSSGGIHNILLGADEVGRGCILSAHGKYFAHETAIDQSVTYGDAVEGTGDISLADIPVRCLEGKAVTSSDIAASIERELEIARDAGRHALVHVVHGSKTGLILPSLSDIDQLQAAWGDIFTLVVDACQARITGEAIRQYIDRGAIVFLTGSKFMGGAPFGGMALVPSQMAQRAQVLPAGFTGIFRRAEWPLGWPGRDELADTANPGLALRLEAAIHELERFRALERKDVERVIAAFQRQLKTCLVEPFGFALVRPYPEGEGSVPQDHPLEMLTLATLDVSPHPGAHTIEDAEKLHRKLALSGIRLGQPVKSVRTPQGSWAGTLRIGLSMPQVVEIAQLGDDQLDHWLSSRFGRIAAALQGDVVDAPAL